MTARTADAILDLPAVRGLLTAAACTIKGIMQLVWNMRGRTPSPWQQLQS